jgi:hypothetical protein
VVLLMRYNQWNNDRLGAGAVGSVGDVNGRTRFKQSAPDMPMRWKPGCGPWLGSNVQDGFPPNYLGNHGPILVVRLGKQAGYGYEFEKNRYWVLTASKRICTTS